MFPIQLFWLLISVGSLVACIVFSYSNIIEFYDNQVTTEIRINDEPEAFFPTVIIFNYAYFTTEYALEYLKPLIKSNQSIK